MFYRITGDYQLCVKEYGELIVRYAADVVGHNQLALCSSKLRNMRTAVDEMRRVVELLPNRVLFRDNLALYANYASDFQTAEKEARTIRSPTSMRGWHWLLRNSGRDFGRRRRTATTRSG
jgi:hypothetical protein